MGKSPNCLRPCIAERNSSEIVADLPCVYTRTVGTDSVWNCYLRSFGPATEATPFKLSRLVPV